MKSMGYTPLGHPPLRLWRLTGVVVASVVVIAAVAFVLLWQYTPFDVANCVVDGTDCSLTSSDTPAPLPPTIPDTAVDYTTLGGPSFSTSSSVITVSWEEGPQYVNTLSLAPSTATGFPSSFTILPFGLVYTSFQVGSLGLLVFCFTPVLASTFHLVSYSLTAFNVSGVIAGYNPAFEKLTWISNQGSGSVATFKGVGVGAFNPANIVSWIPDARQPLIASLPGGNWSNVYAPDAVWTGNDTWNIYYGGQDLWVPLEFDNVYSTSTTDAFLSFGQRRFQVNYSSNLYNAEVNNEGVLRLANGSWYMMYTDLVYMPVYLPGTLVANPVSPYLNKPGVAVSTDGVNWTPTVASFAQLVNMTGYTGPVVDLNGASVALNWTTADLNGANVPYFNGETFEMYFAVANDPEYSVNYATSTDGLRWQWQAVFPEYYGSPQCIRKFTHNGTNYFFVVYVRITPEVWYTLSSASLATPPPNPLGVLFPSVNLSLDATVDTAGIVENGTHLLGVLYGAGPDSNPNLTTNSIFARWLQRAVVVGGVWRQCTAMGPGVGLVPLAAPALTAAVTILEADNATVLFTSPPVTVAAGDTFIWGG